MKKLALILIIMMGFSGCAPGDVTEPVYFDEIYVSSNTAIHTIDGTTFGGGSTNYYGEIYITTPITTTCTVAGTYYLVAGSTTSDELSGFTASNGRLTYIGTGARIVGVAAAISVRSDTNNVVLGTKVYKNGVEHPASFIQRKIATAGDVGAQAIITLIALSTNDYVEIYISSDKAGAIITFNGMSLTVSTVD